MPRTDNNGYSVDKKGSRRAKRSSKRNHEINWDVVPMEIVGKLIQSATKAGGAVRFGGTRDHGALAVGVYGDGEPYTEYFRDPEEFAGFAEELILFFEGVADTKELPF